MDKTYNFHQFAHDHVYFEESHIATRTMLQCMLQYTYVCKWFYFELQTQNNINEKKATRKKKSIQINVTLTTHINFINEQKRQMNWECAREKETEKKNRILIFFHIQMWRVKP